MWCQNQFIQLIGAMQRPHLRFYFVFSVWQVSVGWKSIFKFKKKNKFQFQEIYSQ